MAPRIPRSSRSSRVKVGPARPRSSGGSFTQAGSEPGPGDSHAELRVAARPRCIDLASSPHPDQVLVMRRPTLLWRAGLSAAALTCCSTAATAQFSEPPEPRAVGVTAAFGCNVLLGGLTAATRALIEGHDPARAFAIGAIGGAVHFGAKLIGPGTSLAGVAIGATGTAIVVNAGRGVSPLDELYLPVGPLRLRVTPRESRKLRVAVNATDAVVLTRNLMRPGLVMDWGRTASSGTVVLLTENRRIRFTDREVQGLAAGSTIVISAYSTDPAWTTRHELTHVHQNFFLEEAWGRPAEDYLRRRVPVARRLPRWLELGVVSSALSMLEQGVFGRDGPMRRLKESEADMLARR